MWASSGNVLDRIEFTTNQQRHFSAGGPGGKPKKLKTKQDEGKHARFHSFGIRLTSESATEIRGYYLAVDGEPVEDITFKTLEEERVRREEEERLRAEAEEKLNTYRSWYFDQLKETNSVGESDGDLHKDNEVELFKKDYYSGEYTLAKLERITVWESFDANWGTTVVQGYGLEYEELSEGVKPIFKHLRSEGRGEELVEKVFWFSSGEYITHLWASAGCALDRIEFTTNQSRHFVAGGPGGSPAKLETDSEDGKHARFVTLGTHLSPYEAKDLRGYYILVEGSNDVEDITLKNLEEERIRKEQEEAERIRAEEEEAERRRLEEEAAEQERLRLEYEAE
jgi:hypothetical protein